MAAALGLDFSHLLAREPDDFFNAVLLTRTEESFRNVTDHSRGASCSERPLRGWIYYGDASLQYGDGGVDARLLNGPPTTSVGSTTFHPPHYGRAGGQGKTMFSSANSHRGLTDLESLVLSPRPQ
jgi:hypothetical protein